MVDFNFSATTIRMPILLFWYKFATNLSRDMDLVEDIKEDILLSNIQNLMKNNF